MEHMNEQTPNAPESIQASTEKAPVPKIEAASQVSPVPTDASLQAAVGVAKGEALAIAELCQLAGHPERTAGFLAAGASEQSVRQALLATRAQSEEITSVIHPEAKRAAGSPDQNPLIRAVKNICGKE